MAIRHSYRQVSSLLRYDPLTGHLFWREQRGKMRANSRAGTRSKDGKHWYWHVQIDRRFYTIQQIAWLLMTKRFPTKPVDFRNTNTLDTRWKNLVLATYSERAHRATLTKPRAPLVRKGKFVARIMIHYRERHLGAYDRSDQAHAVVEARKRELLR